MALHLPQIRETRRTVRDSDSGLEQMSIGHHIRDRAHILQRSRNHRTGDQEERQDYINLDESKPPSSSSLPASCRQPPSRELRNGSFFSLLRSLGREDSLEKEMATHSSILAWEIPWTVEPGGLQSMGLQSQSRLSPHECSLALYLFLGQHYG